MHSRTASVGTRKNYPSYLKKEKELVDIKGNYQAVGLTQTKENIFQTVIS